jgi:hypothetical protein
MDMMHIIARGIDFRIYLVLDYNFCHRRQHSSRSSTVLSRKKLKGRDNPRVDGGVALHVFDWQSVAGDRLHTGRQRDASGTQSQAGRGPGRGSQHESPAILLHLGLGQCIEIANDGGP